MFIYNAIALAYRLARLDGHLLECESPAVVKNAATDSSGVLSCRVGAGSGRTVIAGLAVSNRKVTQDGRHVRTRYMKYAVTPGAAIQSGRIDNRRRAASFDCHRVLACRYAKSPVAAAFSWLALLSVRLYVVAGSKLITTGSGPGVVFAFLTAPRKLQSLAAAVQADAAATSSVRSTLKVVTKAGARFGVTAAARSVAGSWSVEFEDAFGVSCGDALTYAMMVNDKRASLVFIVRLQPG